MSQEDYERICAALALTASTDHPQEYDQLQPEMQVLLAYWISHALKPAPRLSRYSSYGMTLHFEHQTEVAVSHAAFKGAMLVAGYLPTHPHAQYWRFQASKTYDYRTLSHDHFKRREYRQLLPYYRTCLDGGPETPLQQLIAEATGQREIRLLSLSEVFEKAARKKGLLQEAERDKQQRT